MQTLTKEKPMIIDAEGARLIREGRKTQARWPVKPQPKHHLIEGMGHITVGMDPALDGAVWYDTDCVHPGREVRPPYPVGTRCYIKETWASDDGKTAWYRADGETYNAGLPWRSPVTMPRWAARTWVEIVDVRAERVQAITEEDAVAQGMTQQACANVLEAAAGKAEIKGAHHLETPEGECWEDGMDLCVDCAEMIAKRHGLEICGHSGVAEETDGPAYCAACQTAILVSLTKYGVERELLLEEDDLASSHMYSVAGMDAKIASMIAGGIGDLRDEHLGRLAQIGFATWWDSIHAPKGYPWADNPWVFAYTLALIEGDTGGPA